MKKGLGLVCLVACCFVFAGEVLANNRTDDPLGIAISPQALILGMEQSGRVTVHTDIPGSTVNRSTVALNDIPASSTWVDLRGNLVAGFSEVEIGDTLADIVTSTYNAGGNIVIPSFALQRAQEILYHLNVLQMEDRIPDIRVYLDSPMAIRITEVFKRYTGLYDREMKALLREDRSPFDFPGLTMVETADESKKLNYLTEPAMIIAGSGMCTGGRIKHHLVNNIARPESTILFVGYQAEGTLGRHIINGAKSVRIFNQQRAVRARIEQINGFSAHADQDELLRWLSRLEVTPKRIFVTHGEEEVAEKFCEFLAQKTGLIGTVPTYNSRISLE